MCIRGSLSALHEFFAAASDATTDDLPRIIRFLRARKNNLPDALALWRQDQEWRAREHIDEIMTEHVDSAVERAIAGHYAPMMLDEYSHDGRLVMYRQLGELDMDKLSKQQGIEMKHLTRRHVREMERLRRKMDSDTIGAGALAGHLSILDLKGTSLLKFLSARSFWQVIGGLDGTHYAETLGALVIINPPPLTQYALNTVKAFIDPVTASKITVRNGPPSSFLHEYVAVHVLPDHLRPAPSADGSSVGRAPEARAAAPVSAVPVIVAPAAPKTRSGRAK